MKPSLVPLSCLLLTLSPASRAAEINWGIPFNIGNNAANVADDFDSSRNGGRAATGITATVAAMNFGYSGVVVNGVPFTASAGDTDYWSGTGLDPQIDALLSGHTAFSEPYGVQTKTLTLSGLLPGRPYQIQIIGAHDSRTSGSINQREYEIGRGTSFTGTIPVLKRGAAATGGYGTVIGTFVADAVTQDIAVRSNRQDNNLTDDADPAVTGYVLIGDFADANGDGQPDGWPPVQEPIVFSTLQQIPAAESAARIVERAAKLLPRPSQVAWQRLETTFFIHFGPNTFNGVEWGTGTESPSLFNPTALDAAQWVNEMADAGGKQLVLVVKHHDGFCLWPSRYTAHDVASSPWRGGAGDLLREVSQACQARGLKLGVYLSPADLYQIESGSPEGFYGNASSSVNSAIPTDPASFQSSPATGRTAATGFGSWNYTVDDYNRYFLNQLYELLTEYGPIHEVWFDGANPNSGTSQTYVHAAWYDLIRKLQPEAVIFGKGPDLRWVGNEDGTARDTEWSVIPLTHHPDIFTWPDMTNSDLGSRARLVPGSYLWWYPAEADVPLLNGWFWNSSKVPKSASELIDIHYRSVGRNSNLLLNLSPDTRGLIPDNQLSPLRSMAQVLRNTFAADLADGAAITAAGSGSALMGDGDLDTFWEAPEASSTAEIILQLPASKTFDVVSLQEAIATRGQRIEGVAIDTWSGSAWQQRATTTTVGHKQLIRLASPVATTQVRIRITASRLNPSLAEVALHKQAVATAAPVISDRTAAGAVTLTHAAGRPIRYTLDGSTPTAASPTYASPIPLPLGGLIRTIAIGSDGLPGLEASKNFAGVAPVGWTASADSTAAGSAAGNAIDGSTSSTWASATGAMPHWIHVDMAEARWIGGFSYLPPAGGGSGTVTSYRFETSDDGSTWTERSAGTFGNMTNNPVRQDVPFEPVKARWFRFTGLAEVTGGNTVRVADISVIAAGFDAWKRDRGEQSLLPDDVLQDGSNTALAAYFLGNQGGLKSTGPPAAGDFRLELVARREIADIELTFQLSDDLADWDDPQNASLVSTEALAADIERSVWSMSIPAGSPRGFARAVFVLR